MLHLLPTLWFRNTWSWFEMRRLKPSLSPQVRPRSAIVKVAEHVDLGRALLVLQRGKPALLFTENETNTERIFGQPNQTPYVKDGINNYRVQGQTGGG